MSARILTVVIVLVIASAAAAQYTPGGVPIGAYGSGGYGWGGHSSTYAEGVQRGYADMLRSQGMANLLNSEASKNYEDARKKYMENRMQATQTYFEMRRYNTEARRAEKASPLSMEGYVRLARQQAPAQLSTSQLDPLTGTINWPAQLRQPEYAALRASVEKLFHDRAAGVADPTAIAKACEAFQDQLKADISKFPGANEYTAAKNFLSSLSYVSRSPV